MGIFLVVIGHLWYESNLPIINTAIYSFHMPLFFILAGFTIKTDSNKDLKGFIKKQIIRLLLPAIFFILIFLPVYLDMIKENDKMQIIKRICFFDGLVPYNAPCWFLIVLFEIRIFEYFLNISSQEKYKRVLYCLILFIIGFAIHQMKLFLPFGWDKCIVGFGFVIFGTLIKEKYFQDSFAWRKFERIFFYILVCIIWIMTGLIWNDKVSMYDFRMGRYWMFIFSGISGSLLCIKGCICIDRKTSIFRFWGQNTVFIICTHYILTKLFKEITFILHIQRTYFYDVMAIIYTITLLCCYIPVCKFVNKYVPIFNGRHRKKAINSKR